MNIDKPSLKRRNETAPHTTRQRPKLNMNQAPRIPVRSTLASRSNRTSPTTSTVSNQSVSTKRLSNQSVLTTTKRLSNQSASTTTKRFSNQTTVSTTKRPSNQTAISSSTSKLSSQNNKPVTVNGSKKLVTKNSSPGIPKFTGDIKGKMNYLQTQLEDSGEQLTDFEKLKDDLESNVQNSESLLQEALQKVQDLESTIESTRSRHQEELAKHQEKYMLKNRDLILENDQNNAKAKDWEIELKQIEDESRQTFLALEEKKRENIRLKATLEKSSASFDEVDAELRVLKMKLKSAGSALEEHEGHVSSLSNEWNTKDNSLEGLEKALFEQEILRRKLHNTIQELKGNIRVFCRVRPSLESDSESNLAQIKIFGEDQEHMELREQVSSTIGKSSTKTHNFTFDRVFSPSETQKDCFEEISQLVQSALDGYNVCIFAYGQTGSGKTYTMQGPNTVTESTVGMIPRAVQQIYDVAQRLKQFGWHYTMEGQFLEIYNETIHDLLGDATKYGQIKHEIHHEKNGKTTVSNMTTVELDSPSKVKMMLRKASQNRATGATNLNERSSRSHSVFTLKLIGYNTTTDERTAGILNLIDLAGSERLSTSGSVGDRLRETQAINKSLSCLGDVIHALVNNKEGGHIPYRNSKLTYLLRNSLGGNCKTLMFVNVSPMIEHFGESLCSLRFATKVNSCHIGTAKKAIK
ncbi:P-loop containing nucleoside triphosphate hydrolase protein [Thamnidium elegans]|nr:P-loop containing nucleoside triphosphate hydrolase protein [Thamnidium elegans]